MGEPLDPVCEALLVFGSFGTPTTKRVDFDAVIGGKLAHEARELLRVATQFRDSLVDGLDNSGPDALPTTWKTEGIQTALASPLLLGPEPLIGAQAVQLWRSEQPQQRITVATDGVRPFAIVSGTPAP